MGQEKVYAIFCICINYYQTLWKNVVQNYTTELNKLYMDSNNNKNNTNINSYNMSLFSYHFKKRWSQTSIILQLFLR